MAVSTELGKIVASLRGQKHPFADIRASLAAGNHEVGGGWDKLLEKLGALDHEAQADCAARLTQILMSRAIAGLKDLHIFVLDDDEEVRSVSEALVGLVATGPYVANFPVPLAPSELAGKTSDLCLTKVSYKENGDVQLIFCSTRLEYDKVSYGINEVNSHVQAVFVGFDRLVAVKKIPYQTFDVLNFRPGLKRIEVLVDQPHRMSAKESTEDRCLAILASLASRSSVLNRMYENNSPLNLYSCIDSMYQNSAEGSVKRLAFRAPSHSQKREQLSSDGDLRTEDFHAAGVLKVGIITVYDITIQWAGFLGIPGGAVVRIKINVGSLSTAGAYVRSAEVDCNSDQALAVVANKLVSYSGD